MEVVYKRGITYIVNDSDYIFVGSFKMVDQSIERG